MLSGDNGILQKATDAKTYSEKASVIEQAQTDVLGYQVENNGKNLEESQLKSVLEKYFIKSEIPEELPNDLSTLELNTQEKYGTHKIKVSEIYNGNLSKTQKHKKLTEIIKNTDYGKSIDYSVTVNGTTLNNWKVFLNDSNNIYIILGDYLEARLIPDATGLTTYSNHKYSVERSMGNWC